MVVAHHEYNGPSVRLNSEQQQTVLQIDFLEGANSQDEVTLCQRLFNKLSGGLWPLIQVADHPNLVFLPFRVGIPKADQLFGAGRWQGTHG